ncbi:PPC domain-containing DNA-binding protein [Hymenobacter sp. IS2118]|uniref:PPC domain-containing DNA-binding protein n=1 Tax=Hymenobacter sp. IS2118 TaxID=1505605 RepID=UPI000A92F297|nr:PPC domain-containing DNA-binding protein [Hymenobacter sp. IS2118]
MFRRLLFLLLPLLGLFAGPVQAQTPPAVPVASSSPLKTYALRLKPGDDLRQQLSAFVEEHQMVAGTMLTCVGSLTVATLRLANQDGPSVYRGHFEIVSLVGTLSTNGSHLHLAVADSTGRTIGGHLLDGCVVYTTAEIVLGELPALEFRREPDPTFGYRELVVEKAPGRLPGQLPEGLKKSKAKSSK